MKTLLCALLLALQAKPAADPALAITLKDGSVIVAAPPADPLEIRTDYGAQKVPFKAIRLARRTADRGFLVLTPNASLTGILVRDEFEFQTRLGRIRIAARDIQSLTSDVQPSGPLDEATVAYWSFSEGSGDTCHDRVKGRPLKLQNMEFREEPDGRVSALRKSPQAYGSAPCDADLELAEGDFTIEVCFKGGPPIQGASMLVHKGNPLDNNLYDFGLFVQAGGTLYVYSARTGANWQTPRPVIRSDQWTYVAVVSHRQAQKVVLYVNGKPVMEQRQALAFGGGGHPVSVGTPPAIAAENECPERFRFLRISKVARKPEYIAEVERGFAAGGAAETRSGARSADLRDGSHVRLERLLADGAVFRTRWGGLRVAETTSAQIQLYRMREPELVQARIQAEALIRQLGAAGVEEREQATAKLIDLAEAALPLLKEARDDADREVRSRVAEILKRLEEAGAARRPVGDVLRVGDTILHGWLDVEEIDLLTRFGKFKANLRDVERLNLGRRESRGRPVVRLKSGEAVEVDPVPGSKLLLESPFGTLSIPFEDVQRLSFDAAKGEWSVKTDRLRSAGRISGTLEMETPIGRVKLPFEEFVDLRTPGSEPADPSPPPVVPVIVPDNE